MKKVVIVSGLIGLLGCNNVEKLDKQLYDSTESTAPITKLDALNELDKQDAAADTLSRAKDSAVKHH